MRIDFIIKIQFFIYVNIEFVMLIFRQKLLTIRQHMGSFPCFGGISVADCGVGSNQRL